MIPFWQIPVAAIPAIKAGADFTTPEGTVIPNRDLTLPPHPPPLLRFCSDTTYIPAWP
jgi:ribonuclease Z